MPPQKLHGQAEPPEKSRKLSIQEEKLKRKNFAGASGMLEKRLHETEIKFRAVMQSSVDAILLVNDDHKIVTWNKIAQKLFGYKNKDVIGKSYSILFPDECPYIGAFEPEEQYSVVEKPIEVRARRENRTELPVEVSISTWDTGKEKFHVFVVRDITERKQLEAELKKTQDSVITVITAMLEKKDYYTVGHQRRVAKLACSIAKEMNFPEDKIAQIKTAAQIHDIGKISLPVEILTKSNPLTDLERGIIKTHPQVAYDILSSVDFPWPVTLMVMQHHERMDGSGYPRGIPARGILPEARIIAVADVVEAVASHRPYRPRLGLDVALDEIEKNSGKLYDPDFARACLRLFREKRFSLNGPN